MAVVTGLGVILAISASRSFAPASVCLASTTMTLVLPMIMVLLPPAPPRPTHTSGFNCFIVSGGGGCCAMADGASAPSPITRASPKRVFTCDIGNDPFAKTLPNYRNGGQRQASGDRRCMLAALLHYAPQGIA